MTVQPGTSARPAAGGSVTSFIHQVQIGCQRHCFAGTDPIVSPADPKTVADLGAIEQLLSSPAALNRLLNGPAGGQQFGSGPGGPSRLLAALLPDRQPVSGGVPVGATGGVPVAQSSDAGPDQVPGGQENVDQASYQAQTGGPGTTRQTQIATQVNSTVQAGSAPSAGAAGGAGNQVRQGIWQLQVGCIFDCTHTEQVQQAAQSDTLIVATSRSPGSAAAGNTAVMRISQLQIGCLFWCYATVQVQSASAEAGVSTVPIAVPSAGGSGSRPSADGSASTGRPVGSTATAGSPETEGRAEPSPSSVGRPSPPGSSEVRPSASALDGPGPLPAWSVAVQTRPGLSNAGRLPASVTDPLPSVTLPALHAGRPVSRATGDGWPVGALVALSGAAILLLAAVLSLVWRGATGRRL